MKTIKIKTESGWKEIEVSDESFKNIEKEVQPEFKVGDWVIGRGHYGPRRPDRIKAFLDGDREVEYDSGECNTLYSYEDKSNRYVRHATPEEIKEHLIKEAEKRGFKEGVRFKSSYAHKDGVYRHNKLIYCKNTDMLMSDGDSVYYDGKWAEIVEEENVIIKIGKYNVFFDRIGQNISVGFYSIDFETVKKIYKRMKKLRS